MPLYNHLVIGTLSKSALRIKSQGIKVEEIVLQNTSLLSFVILNLPCGLVTP